MYEYTESFLFNFKRADSKKENKMQFSFANNIVY